MVGRKREFNREEALEKAMELFWSKGYNAVGLNELLQRMGIQRQSLYNTFGCEPLSVLRSCTALRTDSGSQD